MPFCYIHYQCTKTLVPKYVIFGYQKKSHEKKLLIIALNYRLDLQKRDLPKYLDFFKIGS
jgi:hypothetical protein